MIKQQLKLKLLFFNIIFLVCLFCFNSCDNGFKAVAISNSNFSSEGTPNTGSNNPPGQSGPNIETVSSFPEVTSYNKLLEFIDPPPVSPLILKEYPPYKTQVLDKAFAMVYVRLPRTQGTMAEVNYLGTIYNNIKNWDAYDKLPEVSFQLSRFSAPGQLVYRGRDGKEKIIFDCMNKTPSCVPMDPAVSFDGKRIIFSVVYGEAKQLFEFGEYYPNKILTNVTHAKLFIYDVATEQLLELPSVAGTHDTGPVFLPDGKIMFTSTRVQQFMTSHYFWGQRTNPQLQLWVMDGDGANAHRVGPHDTDSALHPYVMSNGHVLFSTWQISHLRAHSSNNGSVGNPGTIDNKFWLASVDYTGGNWNAVFGAHIKGVSTGSLSILTIKAMHFVAETSDGWLCTTDYYRANNLGGGAITCWQAEEVGNEGRGPSEVSKDGEFIFSPRNVLPVAKWANSDDTEAKKIDGVYVGKLRDPYGLPGNQLLLSYMRGFCTSVQGRFSVIKRQDVDIGCDAGIYHTTQIPSNHPNDLKLIIDRPEWHEIMPKVVEPYSFIYGKVKPDTPPVKRDSHGRCILASSSMESEIEPKNYSFNSPSPCAKRGCKSAYIPTENIKAMRFWEVLPNSTREVHKNNIGHRHKLLGDVALLKDGSFAVELPCNTPYVMAGIDHNGAVVTRDQVTQSLRPGEVRTCTGCHLHSKPGRPFEHSLASKMSAFPALGKSKVPEVKNSGLHVQDKSPVLYDFKTHVQPIFENKCLSCHSGDNAAAGLRLDIPGHDNTSTWYRLVWDYQQTYVPAEFKWVAEARLEKPNASKYVNSVFAINSLLLWKVANKRLDGTTDSASDVDIDFGKDHPTDITNEEFHIIKNWLDAGAYHGRE